VMVEAPARVVEPVVRHELEDLQHTLLAGNPRGKGDLGRLRACEWITVLEDVIGEHPSHSRDRLGRLLLDGNAAACVVQLRPARADHRAGVRGARRHDRVWRKTRLHHVSSVGPIGRERDAVMARMEHDLENRNRDHAAFLIGGDDGEAGVVESAYRRTFVAAWPELLRRPVRLIVHRPRGWGHEIEVGARGCSDEHESRYDRKGKDDSGEERNHRGASRAYATGRHSS
jgi:hypothetical protein